MIISSLGMVNYHTSIEGGNTSFEIDEPESNGGKGRGSTPTQHFLAALGSCVAITLRMYSERKGWDLGPIRVETEVKRVEGKKRIIETIYVQNELPSEQMDRLNYIAKRCPIALMIKDETMIESKIEVS